MHEERREAAEKHGDHLKAAEKHDLAAQAHRTAAEQELFGGRYTLTSKNDDDLPVWH